MDEFGDCICIGCSSPKGARYIIFLLGVSSSVWDCRLIRRSAEDARKERGPDKGCALPVIVGIRRIGLTSMLHSHNGGAVRRVSARIGSCFSLRADCYWPTGWRVLRESEMNPVLVVVEHVFRHQPFEMPLIQDDHVVKQVSSTLPTERSATPFCQGL